MDLSEKQIEIIGHSLGVNVYHAKKSKKKADKRLPKDFFRNRFCAGEAHNELPILISLEQIGFMKIGGKINEGRDSLWYVTESGISAFRSLFSSFVL